MSKIDSKSDADNLQLVARTILLRNGRDPMKSLAQFITRLQVSSEIRALIGAELIRYKATKYLETQVEKIKQVGIQQVSDNQKSPGPQEKPVHVRDYQRNLPGQARHGLKEIQEAAKVSPLVFTVKLSNGMDFKKMCGREVRKIVPNTSFDFAMAIQAQRYAQFDDEAIMSDVIPDDVLKLHGSKAKRFSEMVTQGVQITIDAFLAMDYELQPKDLET